MDGRTDEVEQVGEWAASGAMALTGPPDGEPLGPPAGLVPRLRSAAARIQAAVPGAPALDPLALLGERAAISRHERGGAISCGGGTRLLRSGRDWVAVTLARPEDVEMIPAWLEVDRLERDEWTTVADAMATGSAAALVERGALLGLPVALLPAAPTHEPAPIARTLVAGPGTVDRPLADLLVVDLSALWAGPLCGALLGALGARVVKVESLARPDGARRGPAAFFDLLNAGKAAVALDLRAREGLTALRDLVGRADVVIEASRPRALRQLGLDAAATVATGPRVWASITGHGREGPGRERVGFGDDAAVAGGLVSWAGSNPCFCVDAVADPVTGLLATAAVLDALDAGGRWLLDVSMARVAAHLAGPTLPVPEGRTVAPPRARPAAARGPRLGEHTALVLAERRSA